ncbi:hypothetical protein O181_080283 [Austropuccinia psidii MF-1]|uniref:Uncharacterized protein n=1 Tax=Austropuccinia psidii MF-1 TaxID=1389203 RepID=A0A9Q3FMK8_9BASI|nr:hypothetical protein [Austropuccinia psidii MF-1]
MSSKLTELTDSSPPVPQPSVLCGSGILRRLASSGHFDSGQTCDGYKAVEVLDPPCTEFLAKGKKPSCCPGTAASNIRRYLWSKEDRPFGKEFPVSEGQTPNATSGYSDLSGSRKRDVARWTNVGGSIPGGDRPISSSSAVPFFRINTEGVVKRIRGISNSPPDRDAKGSDELDGSSHTRPAINPAVRPSPIQQCRDSPIDTSHKLQLEASSSRRREELSPLLFPAAQVFQQRDCWPIQVTREHPNMASENQDAVARFRQVDRNSREVIIYANDRTIPDTAPEEMAEIFSWYEDELINDLQRTLNHMGRDN